MIIPVRCFTCSKVLADMWTAFKRRRDERLADKRIVADKDGYYNEDLGDLLDELGLKRICCRRHMICHVDLIDKI